MSYLPIFHFLPSTSMILITGATGNLGSLVVEKLSEKIVEGEKLAVSCRQPEKLEHLKERGIEVRYADYNDKNSLIQCFRGVKKVLFVSGHAANDERINQHKNVVSAAVLAGTKHLHYTSFINPAPYSKFTFAEVHQFTEELLKHSGLTYTIYRNSWYADLLLEGIEQTLESGKFMAAAGESRINSIPREEIANVLAKTLSVDRYGNSTFELTGPETFTYPEAVEWISEAYEQPVTYMDTNSEQVRKMYGGDSPFGYEINGILSSYEAMQAGEYDFVSEDFENIMGRKPMSVRDFIFQQAKQAQTA